MKGTTHMRIHGSLAALALLLPACSGKDAPGTEQEAPGTAPAPAASASPPPDAGAAGARWTLQSGAKGTELAYSAGGAVAVRLICGAGGNELLVNVPTFSPVASEERLSFGSNGEVVALVADTTGDRARGGVTGAGPVPSNLDRLVRGPVAINHGYQTSGPHAAPPADLRRAFVAACREGSAPPA